MPLKFKIHTKTSGIDFAVTVSSIHSFIPSQSYSIQGKLHRQDSFSIYNTVLEWRISEQIASVPKKMPFELAKIPVNLVLTVN